ncbi:MAG TPA: bifunctional UDP-N-acetylmuramoyl-tripeptide:D-alanyl-D-alanine ligase/alanine racemase [Bacteroidales bacterium]|nr:bifunctional UDP-N-acetylmuramoyl-tripeptide:D-alanyl-D-alanine ligase/alanine racemase [Bacteroidales bacterium]
MKAHLLVNITGGDLMGDGSLEFTSLVTDSRTTGADSTSLFVALRGVNHDGHRFINDLYNRGVRVFLVDNFPSDTTAKKGSAFIRVPDTLEALQKIAAWRRNNFRGKVIAVTGSAGKTVVKEWLADIMSVSGRVVRSPKSYNSQVGVPLSLWSLNDSYDVAVIEAGISRPGEMDRLASIINPDVVIITNIGEAHGENFHDKKSKAMEKLRLARGAGMIIYCLDHAVIREEIRKSFHGRETFTWSVNDKKADLFAEINESNNSVTSITFSFRGDWFSVKIPFTDRASIENSITSVAAALSQGVDPESISRAVQSLPAVAMRMEVKHGINGSTLIEDYYNSDPGSLLMALDFLRSHAKGDSTVILSDFRQIGGEEKTLYSSVAAELKNAGIRRFIGIGEALTRQKSSFSGNCAFFNSTEEFLAGFRASSFGNETILLKGARVFGFERIGSLLEQQLHQTRFEINLGAVVHNLNEFRRILSPGTGVMAMVKAFAYGSGSAEIASLLEYNGVNYFAVAFADEGVALRDAGISAPIMVMNPHASVMDMMIRYNLEPEIYSLDSYQSFLKAAAHNGVRQYPIHIKIDTGMHRLGFNMGETVMLAGMLQGEERVRVAFIFSHLAGSDDPTLDHFSHKQAHILLEASEIIREKTGYSFGMHLLNSSGIPRFPQYQFNMVRPGIGLYGIGDYPGLKLQHTGRFVTSVSQVKDIPAGDPVGYGCLDIADHARKIAIVPVGYADGLRRSLGNGHGHLFIGGKKTPLVGNICMDMCMTDVTGLDVRTGDSAEIFGENISIEEVARWCNTIPYEILTSIPARVNRVYYNE